MDMTNIAARLELKFGLGSRPDLRRQLYEQLETIVNTRDGSDARRAYSIIASAAVDATGKRDPGRYFSCVVMRRLEEAGILQLAAAAF